MIWTLDSFVFDDFEDNFADKGADGVAGDEDGFVTGIAGLENVVHII